MMLGTPHLTNRYIDVHVNLNRHNVTNENVSETSNNINENSSKQTINVIYKGQCIFGRSKLDQISRRHYRLKLDMKKSY